MSLELRPKGNHQVLGRIGPALIVMCSSALRQPVVHVVVVLHPHLINDVRRDRVNHILRKWINCRSHGERGPVIEMNRVAVALDTREIIVKNPFANQIVSHIADTTINKNKRTSTAYFAVLPQGVPVQAHAQAE